MPSAPEMEELGKDEGVVPEALAPPVLKACPVVVKKIKTQQLKVPQGEEQPPPQVVACSMVHPYTQAELVAVGLRGGWNCSVGIRDGKAVFPDSAAHLEAEITKCEVTHTVAEAMRTWKEIRPVTHKRNLRGPMRVTRTQMWVDLIWAGVDGRKLDRKPNRILLELWQRLKPEQQFQPLKSKRQRSETEPRVWPVCLQDFLLESLENNV